MTTPNLPKRADRGWEYLFIIDYGEHRPTHERFLALIDAIHQAEVFNHALPREVLTHNPHGKNSTLKLGDIISKPDEARSIFEHVAQEHRFDDAGYTLVYQLSLYIQMWEEQMPQKALSPRRFIIPQRTHGAEVLRTVHYNAGDLRHFRAGRTRRLNMEILMRELACIADMGVRDIRGLNLHQDEEPHRHSAVYHHEFDGYLEDIYIITGEYYPATDVTREIVLDTLFSEDVDLRFQDTQDLPVVFNTGGTDGDLRHFYEKLIAQLRKTRTT
jgi:hypothetical protein